MSFSALQRLFSTRFRIPSAGFLLVFALLATSSLADQQAWPLPEEVSASLLHEIPVLHTAFVQIGEELHYLNQPIRPENVHHLPVFETGPGAKIDDAGRKKSQFNVLKMAGKGKLPLEVDPPMMDFGLNSVGNAQKRKIYIRNMRNEEIVLDAVAVNSIEFQASYFDQVKLQPHGVASLDVVFLPRELGKRSTVMHFYTSVGMFTYKIQGNCDSNPYRLSPYTGYRLPMNSSIPKPISIFNPFPYTMRITEIGSSGGNAHVELAHEVDSQLAGEPPQYWDIKPYQSKHIATVILVGGTSENSTVFVRIASELHISPETRLPNQDIYLTIPIEVLKKRGVYTTDELLDFGLLRQGVKSEAKVFSVAQYQIGGRLEFETLYVEKGDHTAIYMEFAAHPPIVVYPAIKGSVTLGPKADLVKVYMEGNRVQMPPNQQMKHISGHIIAVSRGGNYNVSIPFRADIFRGDLVSIGNDLSIQEDLRPPHQRVIRIENQLPFDVAIWNISLSSDFSPHFSVRLLDRTVLIGAGHISPVFVLKYNKKLPANMENSTIFVHTNVTTFNLTLSTFTGKMAVELTSVDKNSFDFGFVERNDTRTIRFVVWNHNNAEMRLKNLAVPHRTAYRLYEVGVKSGGNFSDVRNDERLEYVQPTDVDIPAQQGKIFDLELKVPWDGVVRNGNILFETDYESKLFAVSYQVSTGSLQSIPEEISFGQTFPSKLVYRTLQVFNSFDEDMTVTRLTTLNEDPRFFFEGFDPQSPPVLRSGRLTNLGRVMFSPSAPCEHEYCYLGLPLSSSDGAWFTHGLGLPSNLPEIDSYLYKQLRRKYDALVKSGKHHVNTTIILDTDKAKNIKIKTSAELVWPRLLTRNSIHFPLTALGNFTIVNLTLSNPTNVPVAIQVIPLVIYPDAESLVELMRPHLATELTDHVEMNETLMFSLRDTELFTLKHDSPVPKLREAFEHHLNHDMQRYNNEINIPRFTLSMILRPHMKVRLRLGFLPSDYTLRSSLLLIRNNLTALEPVVMYGKGAKIGVKLEGSEARSKRPLLFEIRHDHLTDCNNPKRLMHKLHSTLTVRRPFQVMNSGEVQFTVTNMSINGVPCENRGFRILNCYPFRLQPNETYALDIAYTPDFLTTTNEADLQLYMHMNGSAWLFPLAATVPGDMMAKCHQALPRPPFENIMYYSCVTALIFCLVCVLACAYLEGDRAIACAIRQQFTIPRHVFDLNNLKPATTPAVAAATPPPAPVTRKDKKWAPSTPSTLRASSDAYLISRILIKMANWTVRGVHLVWKWSLFYRKEKPVPEKAKKTPKVQTPIYRKNLEQKIEKNEKIEKIDQNLLEIDPEDPEDVPLKKREVAKSSVTPTAQNPPPPPQIQLSKKAKQRLKRREAQEAANNNLTTSSETSGAPESSGSWTPGRKTSSVAPDSPKLMAPAKKKEVKEPKEKKTSQPIQKTSVVSEASEASESPPTPKTTAKSSEVTPPSRNRVTSPLRAPESSASPESQPQKTFQYTPTPSIPISISHPPTTASEAPEAPEAPLLSADSFYRQFLASSGMFDPSMWETPAARAAMPYMNLWNYGHEPLSTEQMEALIRQATGAPPQVDTPSEASEPMEMEAEEQPEWGDEEITVSDAEADFSAMAAASADIFDEEDDPISRRRRRSPSQASSTLSRRLENSPQKMTSRRLTIGSEKKNAMSSSSNAYEFSRTPGHPARLPPLQMTSAYPTDPFWESVGGGGQNGTSSLDPWGTQAPPGLTIPAAQSRIDEDPNDPLSLSHLGINLAESSTSGPVFGNTMFSGPEFNMWSSSLFQPPTQPPNGNENDENQK